MKLTDEQNKSFTSLLEEAAALDDDKIQDCAVQLLTVAVAYKGDAQAAWQEVDRLREENERLKSQLDDAFNTIDVIAHYEVVNAKTDIIAMKIYAEQAIQRIKREGTE